MPRIYAIFRNFVTERVDSARLTTRIDFNHQRRCADSQKVCAISRIIVTELLACVRLMPLQLKEFCVEPVCHHVITRNTVMEFQLSVRLTDTSLVESNVELPADRVLPTLIAMVQSF
jgi:hypothetical protein